MSRITEVIHADKDRFDDHSDTTQQDVHGAMLESDRPTTNPNLPERKVRKFSLSLSLSLPFTPEGKVSHQPESVPKGQPPEAHVTVRFTVSVHTGVHRAA